MPKWLFIATNDRDAAADAQCFVRHEEMHVRHLKRSATTCIPIFSDMKHTRALLHLSIWLFALLYENAEEYFEGVLDAHAFLLNSSHILAHAVAFYTTLFLLRSFEGRHWWRAVLAVILGALIFIPSRLIFQEVIIQWMTGEGNYAKPWQIGYVYDNLYRPLPTVMAAILLFIVRRQQHTKEKEAEWAKAELAHLRGQIHPHFLFNTLGYVHNRVVETAPDAAEVVLELSSILRSGLRQSSGEGGVATVRDELQLVESYYSIMQRRFNGQCHLNTEYDTSLLDLQIEPLVLLSLTENMFKHGDLSNPEDPGVLTLKLNRELVIHTRNRIQKGDVPEGTGIGLQNIRKRMHLLYGNRFSLATKKQNHYFEVTLKIPQV